MEELFNEHKESYIQEEVEDAYAHYMVVAYMAFQVQEYSLGVMEEIDLEEREEAYGNDNLGPQFVYGCYAWAIAQMEGVLSQFYV